ncbi:Uncharacterised protein [Shigella sonnei]|nr:Uncharacterised protein [Shigella sonnei]
MRNIGHKIAPHLLVFLQCAGKLVEVLRQFAQFIFTGGRYAGSEIARRQFVRAIDKSFYRCQ